MRFWFVGRIDFGSLLVAFLAVSILEWRQDGQDRVAGIGANVGVFIAQSAAKCRDSRASGGAKFAEYLGSSAAGSGIGRHSRTQSLDQMRNAGGGVFDADGEKHGHDGNPAFDRGS